MTTAVIVAATGGVATVAVAAGPVVYSEYTMGGDRESRVVQGDGSGDAALPVDVTGATVSPDGRRIAQTTILSSPGSEKTTSSLRVTAGDGTGATTVLTETAGFLGGAPDRVITGVPVWAPDSRRVVVQRTDLDEGGPSAVATRIICDVDARTCREAGRTNPTALEGFADFRGDVVTWQASDGPIVRDAVRSTSFARLVRCGARSRTVKAPSIRLSGLPGSSFGAPIALRGLQADGPGDSDEGIQLSRVAVGALAIPPGTLLVDAPDASLRRGVLRCAGGQASYVLRAALGVLRVRLRARGRTTTLPTPPGLRRGDGLRLVGTDDGGAVLVSAPGPTGTRRVSCYGRRTNGRVRECLETGGAVDGRSVRSTVLRVWRLVPGPSPRFERVTTARRSALRTLEAASELTVADGNAVLAVTDGAIERVPLDGGVPTTIARGRELSLDVSAW